MENYLDDNLLASYTVKQIREQLPAFKSFMTQAGVGIKYIESDGPIGPKTRKVILGFKSDTVLKASTWREMHVNRVMGVLKPIAKGTCRFVVWQTFEKVVGTLGWMAIILRTLFALMSPYFAIVCEFRGKRKHLIIKRDLRQPAKLKRNAKLMIQCIEKDSWVTWKWLLKDLPYHEVTLYTDASTSFGAGAWFGNLGIQFAWEQLEGIPELRSFWKYEEQINVLELFVIYVAAVYWKNSFKGHLIHHLGDNEPANSWVNKNRSGTHITEEVIIELTLFQRRNNFRVMSNHIAGVENIEADTLSRKWVKTIDTRDRKNVEAIKIDPKLYIQGLISLLVKVFSGHFSSPVVRHTFLYLFRIMSLGKTGFCSDPSSRISGRSASTNGC